MSGNSKKDLDPPWRVELDLMIVHPKLTPGEITAALGLSPNLAHRVGDARTTVTGRPLRGRHRTTRWRYRSMRFADDPWFAASVTLLVDRLMQHKDFLLHVSATGGQARLILKFADERHHTDTIPLLTLIKMVELKLAFGIEC